MTTMVPLGMNTESMYAQGDHPATSVTNSHFTPSALFHTSFQMSVVQFLPPMI